ncbi:MAG: transposase [Alphaproteobacteria bacterium]|nr:transposase [Alphaproteobacteria bacterium]
MAIGFQHDLKVRNGWQRGQRQLRSAIAAVRPDLDQAGHGLLEFRDDRRRAARTGHDVKLTPAQFVRPYAKSNMNDAADAEAISEAVQRPGMRFAARKEVDVQAMLALHRTRRLLIKQRTQMLNSLRGQCVKFGVVALQTRTWRAPRSGCRWRCWRRSGTGSPSFQQRLRQLFLRAQRRRSQKDRTAWTRLDRLIHLHGPRPHIRYPWPGQRLSVRI